MGDVIGFAGAVLTESWHILADSAPYLVFGFLAARVLHGFLSAEAIGRHLGRGGIGPVLKAALAGVPLPLCSCGVIPAALGLRRKGASKGATVSFLVSTPETGVDSIALTYALMDPLMTVARPGAAIKERLTLRSTRPWEPTSFTGVLCFFIFNILFYGGLAPR